MKLVKSVNSRQSRQRGRARIHLRLRLLTWLRLQHPKCLKLKLLLLLGRPVPVMPPMKTQRPAVRWRLRLLRDGLTESLGWRYSQPTLRKRRYSSNPVARMQPSAIR